MVRPTKGVRSNVYVTHSSDQIMKICVKNFSKCLIFNESWMLSQYSIWLRTEKNRGSISGRGK
jgi:hypothetical protein